ncbi:MAG TPA: prolyl oligopeptidase family serine peptidase [Gemmatimonadaceae bacterium]|nr:prolyl oligopeptidase family serine peptidase [Gemmatimonadaceae bacterium]
MALCALAMSSAFAATQLIAQSPLHYPIARKSDQSDTYFGTTVADPYRWLENTDSPETKQWIEAENALTFQYLGSIPERAAIKDQLTRIWNYPKYNVPTKRGKDYFFTENSGLQNQAVLYVQHGLKGVRKMVLDPNTLSTDGTVALGVWDATENGKYLAYAVATAGSDWEEIRVRDVEKGADLSDTLKWVKFSNIAWTKDHKGFFYSRFEEPKSENALLAKNTGQKLYYHYVGEPQAKDRLIYERPDHPQWGITATVSDDGEYVIIYVSDGTNPNNRIFFIDVSNPGKPKINNPLVTLVDDEESQNRVIDNAGDVFFLQTTQDAPLGRVVAVDINKPAKKYWRTLIPELGNEMENVELIGGHFVVHTLQDAHSVLEIYGLRGNRVGRVSLPGIGTITAVSGKPNEWEMFYSYASYLQPASIYRYDIEKRTQSPFLIAKLPVDSTAYETKQLFAVGKDGTKLPIFVTAKKGLTLDGSHPTILYAYGGFDVNMTPAFSPAMLQWVTMGGVYAVAVIRGGGEYGRAWHEAGMLAKKQNVFDDFISSAEYLISQKYTSSKKLAIRGGSNGGLLIGAVETQRPDLAAVALPAVGVMDMLRYQKFTIGGAWAPEYGTSDDSAQFKTLYAYSPLHNIKPGTSYPATLITTADHDDRVVPGHSFKFAATLQRAQAGPAPILIRIDTKAGHGGGKPTSKQIDLATDELAFTVKNLGMSQTPTP